MASSLFGILIEPDTFFQKLMAGKENLVIPTFIILAGAVVGAVNGYLMGSLTAKMMGGTGFGLLGIITAASIIGAFIGIFIYWFVETAIFYLISMVFKGTGKFNRSLEVVGYGSLPQIIGHGISLIIAVVYIPRITVPQLGPESLGDPQMISNATRALMSDPVMAQYSLITMAVSILFLLWSSCCWIYGVKHARQLSLRNAAICVGIPVILYIIYLVAMRALAYALVRV
jgi:hypothetical protein